MAVALCPIPELNPIQMSVEMNLGHSLIIPAYKIFPWSSEKTAMLPKAKQKNFHVNILKSAQTN
jgi:hypothetical protein